MFSRNSPETSLGKSESRSPVSVQHCRSFDTTRANNGPTNLSNAAKIGVGGLAIGMGRKFALLISRNVEPLARLTISSCAHSAQRSRKRFETPLLGISAMKPWLIATGI